MKIDVTEQDIQDGMKDDIYSCPIALAATRVLKKRKGLIVVVKNKSISFWDDYTDIQKITLPKNAQNFIDKLDSEKKVKPFSFTIKYEN